MEFLDILKNYTHYDERDAADRQTILAAFEKFGGDVWTRDNLDFHMVASIFAVNPARTRVKAKR